MKNQKNMIKKLCEVDQIQAENIKSLEKYIDELKSEKLNEASYQEFKFSIGNLYKFILLENKL